MDFNIDSDLGLFLIVAIVLVYWAFNNYVDTKYGGRR